MIFTKGVEYMFFFWFYFAFNGIMIMVSSMARRRRKSSKRKTSSNQFSTEIIGLILILLGILGFGFGPVGTAIKKAAIFMVGELWALVLVLLLFIGVYLLFKRELPTFFSSKLIGFYMLLLVVIVTAHHEFIKLYSPDLIIISSSLA